LDQVEALEPILVVSHDIVGERMAGPGIRYFHLARVLSKTFEVTLAVPHEATPQFQQAPFRILQYQRQDWPSLEPLVNASRVVIFPSDIASDFPQLVQCGACLVVDGYDPLLAEWLALDRSPSPEEASPHWKDRMQHLNQQYLTGDFFVCASERQRNWWLGLLEVPLSV